METSFWEFHFFQKIFFLIILAELNGVEKENRKMKKKNVFQHLLLTSNVILEKRKSTMRGKFFFEKQIRYGKLKKDFDFETIGGGTHSLSSKNENFFELSKVLQRF